MKDTYAKHLKANRLNLEDKNGKNYKHWKWAKLMDFFKPYLYCARYEANSNDSGGGGTEIDTLILSDSADSNDSNSNFESKIDVYHPPEFVETPTIAPEIDESEFRAEKRTLAATVDAVSNFAKKRPRFDLSATEMIFLGYAQTIEKFSPKVQAVTKLKIAQIVMEQELAELEQATGMGHL